MTAVFFLALVMPASSVTSSTARDFINDKESIYDWTGGYADEVYFRVIIGDEQQVLALQSGEIDLIGEFVTPELVPPLITDPNILINQTNRRGYGHITLNCQRAPFNWTALRVAFATALDKDGIQQQALSGYSRPVDSPVPPSMGAWSLDNQESFVSNYYDPDIAFGNAILDAAGFIDIDEDGWREDPNGNPIDFPVEGGNAGSNIVETVVAMSVDAFESIGIRARASLIDFNTLLANVDNDNYEACFFATNINAVDPLILQNFQSFDLDNDPNFVNTTYDDLVETMLSTNDLEEAQQCCWDAQRILWEEQPLVVAYQNLLISAYRKDPWTGYVNTEGQGVFDTWSFLKVQLKDGFGSGSDFNNYKQGGRFTVSLPQQMESTNILNSNSAYTYMTLNLVYESLYSRDPYQLLDGPCIAYDWKVEEVDPENLTATPGAVVGDVQKITYYLHDDYKWHDGEFLTSEDVAFSYQLINDSNSPSLSSSVGPVTHVETPEPNIAEVFCDVGGLFTFHRTSVPIFPQHIWEGIDNPLTWSNPLPIGSGPYRWRSRTPGELVVVERNDDYFYNPRNYDYPGSTDSSSSSTEPGDTETTGTATTETTTGTPGFELFAVLSGFAVMVLVERKRRK